jgi:general secretion pathway protein J
MTRRDAGFTLIEVSIALALTGLIALLLAAALRGGVDGMWRLQARQEAIAGARDAGHFLRRTIQDTPPLGVIARGRPEYFFRGNATELTLPMATLRGVSLARIGLDGNRLVLRESLPPTFTRGLPAAAPATPVLLLEDVREVRFAYHDGRRWLAEWPHGDRLPMAVRIDIAPLNGPAWPTDIVDLPMAVPQ